VLYCSAFLRMFFVWLRPVNTARVFFNEESSFSVESFVLPSELAIDLHSMAQGCSSKGNASDADRQIGR